MNVLDVQCKECHAKLLCAWDDETLVVEQCKNCCEDAYDDGILIGAIYGAPRVEQPEEKRVWCPHDDKSCEHCGVEEICEIPTEPCPREENASE